MALPLIQPATGSTDWGSDVNSNWATIESLLLPNFGDGSDGSATISVDTTLTRSMCYTDLTIQSGKTLFTAGYRVFVSGTLANAGTIDCSGGAGGDASGVLNGGGGLNIVNADLGGSGGASPGATGQQNAGTTSTVPPTIAVSMGGAGGACGAGGSGFGGSFAGGASISGGSVTTKPQRTLTVHLIYGASLIQGGAAGSGGSSGGGTGFGGATSGAGGGGGAGGGVLMIYAKILTNTGTISANGGRGGNGGNPSVLNPGAGGGGGGGGGGLIYLVYKVLTAGTITANGGTKGLKGTAGGSGANGSDGSDGSAGLVLKYNASSHAWE